MVNKNIALFGLITVLSLLSGCFLISSKIGPGYIVSINITDNTVLNNYDIAQLEALAKREQFNKVKEVVRTSDREIVVYYYRELNDAVFKGLNYKFIDLAFVYAKKVGDGTNEGLKEIWISNSGEGYSSEPLKKEIDRIANIFMMALAEKIDVKVIHIERSRTGPPF